MKLIKKILFIKRRIIEAFNPPPVPDNHLIPEEKVLNQYNKFKKMNSLTWLGHSTFLIKINTTVILTDPFLTEFASPFDNKGSRRYVPPGISIEKLPPISIILISHNHYDHLDFKTIKAIPNKEKIIVLIPEGLQKIFKKAGYTNIFEIQLFKEKTINNITFIALPVLHKSQRHFLKKTYNKCCSWAIRYNGLKIYFAGDTSYSDKLLNSIGNKYSPFSYAILPIGSYNPPELLSKSHVSPEEAIMIAQDIHTKNSIAMHWGTIKLSDEPILEPPQRFIQAAKKNNINLKNIWILKIGETRKLGI